ncbi:MAG: DNA polymerase III subunit alpha [Bacteroidales bacterium]|jgi:DNA polymerase-3 subunit alpha|nr:DNA polymerase III subunit alpha [Bacteroidales bacterium]
MVKFTHLHVHSHYSLLDGMSTIAGLIDKAIRTGMYSIALTDHGNMYGIKEFIDYAKKINVNVYSEINKLQEQLSTAQSEDEIMKINAKITDVKLRIFKPIAGCEVYVARRTRFDKTTKEDANGYHLILLAKNMEGYRNLCKLVSAGWLEGYYYRPRIDKDILQQYREGLIVASACLGGEIHKKLEAGDYNAAKEAAKWFKDLFGEDYYIELQRHQTMVAGADTTVYEKQKVQNEQLVSIARELDIKLIATNDVHFVEEEHAEAHDRLICLSTNKNLNDTTRMRYTKQEWLKSPEEMEAVFVDIPEALENTQEIVNKIEHYSLDRSPIMPTFNIPEEFGTEQDYREKYTHEDLLAEFEPDEESKGRIEKLGGFDKVYRIKLEADYLRQITMERAKARYGAVLDSDIVERIEFELDVMRNMGFPGYFLIVQDLIQEARNMDILVGPGRGSAAGSVVSYCLGITDIDPLKYDLLFERFLNPDRISMPDIDIDVEDEGRGKVLNWVMEKYGKEKVAQIITYGTMASKSSIKDVARVQELPLDIANKLTKSIPNSFPENSSKKAPPVTIKNCIEMVSEIKEASKSTDTNISSTIKYAAMLEGTVRQVGVHACGVIIGADDLTNFIPLATAKDKKTGEDKVVTQYEGSSIESVGLIKMDLLGLKTLTIIKESLANIKKSKGIDLDIDAINLEDELTYKLFSEGATVAIFQFESLGMQKYMKDLKPSRFDDLIAMNALYRPGPIQYIPQFIRRKHGLEKIKYPFPEMEKRLKETYGVTVYQEQVMLLSRDLAGFTRGQSDELRKVMGKKMTDTMSAFKSKFIEGATQRGLEPLKELEKIWSDWEEFANYAFNKSHATCYTWVAFQTAYLKAHYPAEFMAANLTNNLDNIKEISDLIADCKRMGINILSPDINESEAHFTVNPKGEIRFGLAAIKGVGEAVVEDIVKERELHGNFTSIMDFIQRINLRTCNKRVMEALALAGAYDTIGDTHRAQFFVESDGSNFLEKLLRYAGKYQSEKSSMQISLFEDMDDNTQDFGLTFPQCTPWTSLEKLNKEREVTGFYISGHPLDKYRLEINAFCKHNFAELEKLDTLKHLQNTTFNLAGMVMDFSKGVGKNGKSYVWISLEDFHGKRDFTIWDENLYMKFNHLYTPNTLLMLTVKLELIYGRDGKSNEDYRLTITNIQLLGEVMKEKPKSITIKLLNGYLNDDLINHFESLINQYQHDRGVSVRFQVFNIEQTVNVVLSSGKKVDAVLFCQEVRKLLGDDSLIHLEG